MAKFAGFAFTLSYVLALSANILVLCGLAALQASPPAQLPQLLACKD